MGRRPAKLFARLWVPSLLFVLAALYCTPIGLLGIDIYDEGIRLHGAERVLNGEVPYRDFYAVYGPAAFYWPALLFKVFGHQVLVFRVSEILFTALLATAVYLLCQKGGVSMGASLLASILVLLPRNRSSVDLLYCDPAIAIILMAGVILTDETSPARRVAAGALIGTAALFRHDFGLYGVLAATGASFFEGSAIGLPFRQRFHRSAASLAWVFLGIGATAGVGYGILAALDFRSLWTNLWTYPAVATHYRMLPFPFENLRADLSRIQWTLSVKPLYAAMTTLYRCFVYGAPFVTAGVVLWRFPAILKLRSPHQPAFVPLFLASFVPGLLLYGLGRSDWAHLLPFFSVSVPFVAVLLHRERLDLKNKRIADTFKRIALSVAAISSLWIVTGRTRNYLAAPALQLERTLNIALDFGESDWFVDAVNDLKGESGSMFVGCDRHDVVFVNALMLYFLSGRNPATYFSQLDPGIATTEPAQRQIIADLKDNNVGTVVVWSYGQVNEPNLSSQTSGVFLLDNYLRNQYYEAKRGRTYSILKRRP
jgi:hypothetical protein